MKHFRFVLALTVTLALLTVSLLTVRAKAQDPQTQNQASAIMRGYRTGYSDGYQAGFQDSTNKASRDFRTKNEYERGDRAYASTYGALEEYRDGYQQGFELGYNNGYDRRPFDSSIPPNLQRRNDDSTVNRSVDPNQSVGPTSTKTSAPTSANTSAIPRDTIMRVELMSNLSTDASQQGDHFQARVIEPKEFEGATIEGHVARVKRPGRAKSTAQMQLSFDEIRMPDGRSSKMSAQVIEVLTTGGRRDTAKVDPEGGVQGRGSTKDDVQKVGAAAGIGAVIGAIAGGGVGAAVGATIGAGVGTAGVLTERGRDIRLYQGQQLRIRTAGNAEIQ
jgi:hypothetical protein